MFSSKTLKFKQNFIGSCYCMFTVVTALFLRETYTLYGASRFGYAWALLRDVFAVGAFIIVKILIGIQYRYGLHIVFFILTGFFVYHVVAECISKCMTAIQANTAILSFPHVFPLDVMISRCLFVFYTNIQSSVVVIILAALYGLDFDIINIGNFVYCIVAALFLGFSAGILMSALAIFYPVVERVWPIIKRLGFWCSGVFFTIDRFPAKYAEPLSYNPVLQLIEGLRKSLYHGIDFASLLNFYYVNFLILIFFTLGLLLLKLSRGRLNA